MSRSHRAVLASLLALALSVPAARAEDAGIGAFLAAREGHDDEIAQTIWGWAEIGYHEKQSSALLQRELAAAGFEVRAGVAGIPTAFVASWGRGSPVIGLLAEFDALPGITQDAVPHRAPLPDRLSGHACGHHLLGTASVSAAIALRDWLKRSGQPGVIRLYGTPAEEGGDGKVYMVRAGLFNDVDAVLQWHPSDVNAVSPGRSLANKKAKFRFYGLSAHASGAPDRGRSALDGVEAMDYMVNLMREHVPSDARIHYVITHGGSAPNVVPDFAEAFYYVRHPDTRVVESIFQRVLQAADGAALGTGTRVEHELIGGVHELLPNETLSRAMYESLKNVGGVQYSAEDQTFAEELYANIDNSTKPLGSQAEVQEYGYEGPGVGSTDVADISWNVPTAGLRTATWVPGTPAHSWQAVAAGGTPIGFKGMHVAARTLALTAARLFQSPDVLAAAREEFQQRRGPDFKYEPIVGNREPPLDYRD